MKRAFQVVALLALLALGLLGLQFWRYFQMEVLDIKPPKFDFRAARQIYPFSVVPGGVYDWKELDDSVTHDPVAREHYDGIKPNELWAERVRKPMMAYVSYRKGGSIHWTDHPVQIAQGEIILTDGKSIVRARCGNRIEAKRPQPLPGRVPPPDVPPPDVVFDVPMPALIPPTVVAPPTTTARVTENPAERRMWRTPVWSGSFRPNTSTVPEPGTIVLVATGVLGLGRVLRDRLRQQKSEDEDREK